MAFAFRLSREKGISPLWEIHGASKFQNNWTRKASLFNDPAQSLRSIFSNSEA